VGQIIGKLRLAKLIGCERAYTRHLKDRIKQVDNSGYRQDLISLLAIHKINIDMYRKRKLYELPDGIDFKSMLREWYDCMRSDNIQPFRVKFSESACQKISKAMRDRWDKVGRISNKKHRIICPVCKEGRFMSHKSYTNKLALGRGDICRKCAVERAIQKKGGWAAINIGRTLTEDHKRKISQGLVGHKAWNKGLKFRYVAGRKKCKQDIILTKQTICTS